jgi:hypothetical protein
MVAKQPKELYKNFVRPFSIFDLIYKLKPAGREGERK